jgi:hypothetical protein
MNYGHATAALTLALGILLSGCNTTPVQDGLIAGGAVGAGLGAIAGDTMGKAGEGALIGAGVGAITGALIGDHIEKSTAPQPIVQAAPLPPPPTVHLPSRSAVRPSSGRYETRTVLSPSGERYEEQVWVPN